MSREAYAPPTSSQPGPTIPFFSTTNTTTGIDGATSSSTGAGALTQYLCGDCNSKVQLKKGDPIRCKECGHRVLYKERTKRYVFFWVWGGLSLSLSFWGFGGGNFLLEKNTAIQGIYDADYGSVIRMVQFEAR